MTTNALYAYWLVCALWLPSLAFCALEDHLKPALNKSDIHTMRNIDFIYMINLDQRPTKWALSNQQLNPYGIFPYRFSAINGWELPLEVINDIGVKFHSGMDSSILGTSYLSSTSVEQAHNSLIEQEDQTYFCYGMRPGPIGIVLSHLSVLRDALQSGYETIWVMEDDVEVLENPKQLAFLIDKLDVLTNKQWDILFTDRNAPNHQGEEVPCRGFAKRPNFSPTNPQQYFLEYPFGKYFIRLGARFGAYSMILRRQGIEKIYNFIMTHSIFLPYDMDYYLPLDIQIYTVKHNIVTHRRNALSDNYNPYYLEE